MKLKELFIISICLVIPLIFSLFLKMNFLITVLASLSISAVGLYLLKKNKFAGKLLAAASTLGIFMAVGNTVYWILNSIIMIAMMYFYVTTDNIEDTLFKIIVLLTTVTIVGLWNGKNRQEGFVISPLKKAGDFKITQRDCQDYCEKLKGCKYAVGPKGNGTGICEISHGVNQKETGRGAYDDGKKKVWKNKNYVSYSGASTNNKKFAIMYGGSKIMKTVSTPAFVPKNVELGFEAGDQGWGNRTDGIFIKGKMNNKTVFEKVVTAPRSSRPIKRGGCKQGTRRIKIPWGWRWRWWGPWWRRRRRRRWRWRWRTIGSGSWNVPTSGLGRYCKNNPYWWIYPPNIFVGPKINTWEVNPRNKKINKIEVGVKSRAQGHTIHAKNVKFIVTGSK